MVSVASSRAPITVTPIPRCSSAALLVMSRRWKPSGIASATPPPRLRQPVAPPWWASRPTFEESFAQASRRPNRPTGVGHVLGGELMFGSSPAQQPLDIRQMATSRCW